MWGDVIQKLVVGFGKWLMCRWGNPKRLSCCWDSENVGASDNSGMPHYFALHFITFFFFYKKNWRFVATLNMARLLASFFQQHLLTLCFYITSWWFLQYFKNFIILLYLLWWSVFCDCKKIMTHEELSWWLAFLSTEACFK